MNLYSLAIISFYATCSSAENVRGKNFKPRRANPCPGGCEDGYFCVVRDGDCGVGGSSGQCYQKRVSRTRSLRTVCGCDGKNYTDRSYAIGAGINVKHIGPCSTNAEIA